MGLAFATSAAHWIAVMDLGLTTAGQGVSRAMRIHRPARVGGVPEAVLDEKTGLLIGPNDVPALASAVRSLLCDPDKAAALGRNARKIALERFDWDSRVVAQYNALYHRMASTKKSDTAQ